MDRLRWAGKYGQSSSLVGYPLGMGEVEGSNPFRSTIHFYPHLMPNNLLKSCYVFIK